MAGLAAALDAPGCIDALRDALDPRGTDALTVRLDGVDGAAIELAVRAVMPAIPRVVGDPGTAQARVVAGFAVDGVASVTALDAGYAAHGPAGLLDGAQPYAVIVADADREALVLARNGDGPGLYYARHGAGWLAASEPSALLRAGVAAAPDIEVVRRFVLTGACDETDRTFFAGIRRVQADEAVTLTAAGHAEAIERPAGDRAPESVAAALQAATGDGRVALLLGPGLPGAALLGTALARQDRLRPLPVHVASFPDLAGPGAHTPTVLVPMPHGPLRPIEHSFAAWDLDLDAFLADVGEPVPDLELYLLWAIGRDLGGEVDTLVDSSHGPGGCVSRLRDRVSARYGIVVRSPLRAWEKPDHLAIQSIVDSRLPVAVARHAANDPAAALTAAEFLLSVPEEAAAALARPRPWLDRAASIDGLRRLVAGEPVDAEPLLRAYLVERWLAGLPDRGRPADGADEPVVATDRASAPEHADAAQRTSPRPAPAGPRPPADVVVGATGWVRQPVPTAVFAPGDAVAGKAAWFASNALVELCADRAVREALGRGWFAVVSAKAVAVAQRRICPLWDIKPRPLARMLARVAAPSLPRLAEPWTMQVALTDGGAARVAVAVLLSRIWRAGGERFLPQPAAVLMPPRDGAIPPADSAVVRGPVQPDETAAALVEALRYTAPVFLVATLAGCAVVSADEGGSRLLGYAAGPNADAVVDAESVVALLCLDNPAGQGGELTPVVLAYPVPRRQPVDDRDEAPGFPAHNAGPDPVRNPDRGPAQADEAAPTH